MKQTQVMLKAVDIKINGGTQQREQINNEIVEEYAEAMRCGARFPAVEVFFDGVENWLADGFHRWHATRAAEIPEILANVQNGTKRQAILFSTGANASHGIRLTNIDKRRAVGIMLADIEWTTWSDRDIAKHCHVTHPFVSKCRSDLVKQVVTVTTKPTKLVKQVETVIAPTVVETATVISIQGDSEYTEIDSLHDQVEELQSALSAAHMKDSTPEEKELHVDLVESLRKELKTANAIIEAVTRSRDQYMAENSQLKNQIAMMQRQAKKAA